MEAFPPTSTVEGFVPANEVATFQTEKGIGRIYVGGEPDVQSFEELRSLGITHILNVASDVDFSPSVKNSPIIKKKINLDDNCDQSIIPAIFDLFKFIDDCVCNGKSIIVHCHKGISRSVSIVIGYMILKKFYNNMFDFDFSLLEHAKKGEGIVFQEIFDEIVEKRSCASPNFGFIGQLYELEDLMIDVLNACFEIFDSTDYTHARRLSELDDRVNRYVSSKIIDQFMQVSLILGFVEKERRSNLVESEESVENIKID